jgi:hypothetical protein
LGRPCGSSTVETKPAGLCSRIYVRSAGR